MAKPVNEVAPHAGAWIEIGLGYSLIERNESLPTRERGLKLNGVSIVDKYDGGRSPRGSVD